MSSRDLETSKRSSIATRKRRRCVRKTKTWREVAWWRLTRSFDSCKVLEGVICQLLCCKNTLLSVRTVTFSIHFDTKPGPQNCINITNCDLLKPNSILLIESLPHLITFHRLNNISRWRYSRSCSLSSFLVIKVLFAFLVQKLTLMWFPAIVLINIIQCSKFWNVYGLCLKAINVACRLKLFQLFLWGIWF